MRGVRPIEIVKNYLWWRGPAWLKLDFNRWPKAKSEVQSLQVHTTNSEPDLIMR
jgi:hypothetical protein